MGRKIVLTREEMERHVRIIPDINPSTVIAMLKVMQAAEEIQHAVFDKLDKDYHISEGKLCVMLILYHHRQGMAPSQLASRAGVTRATISAMLHRLERDGLARVVSDETDRRAKKICLTREGLSFLDKILPAHYLRITHLLGKLEANEQEELICLLQKIISPDR